MAKGETYEEFTAKFEPKRTTDDCYTPPEVFDTVLGWACREYGVDPSSVVRPFYPGGDFERAEYPEGCCVVDNPPFSILSKVVAFYRGRGVHFFLFAPTLTCMGIQGCSKVVAGASVVYENGASVNTSFVTDLDPLAARSAPGLRREVMEAVDLARSATARELPRYEYPPEVLTAPMLARYSKYGVEFGVGPAECAFARALDAQKEAGKSIYGSGYLLSGRAAAQREQAERAVLARGGVNFSGALKWPLSERERKVVEALG